MNGLRTFIALLLLAVPAYESAAQWTTQQELAPTLRSGLNPYDSLPIVLLEVQAFSGSAAAIISGMEGYPSTHGGNGGLEKHGIIYRTADGGATWSRSRVHYQHGFISGEWHTMLLGHVIANRYDKRDSIGYALLRTEDGGDSWREIYQIPLYARGSLTPFGPPLLEDVHFFNHLTGIVVVNYRLSANDYPAIRRTTDAGRTWQTVLLGNQHFDYPRLYGTGRDRISFYNDSSAYVLLGTGTLVKTTDRGLTWEKIGEMGSGNDHVVFPSEMIGYRTSTWDSTTVLSKTTDGGGSWQRIDDQVRRSLCGDSGSVPYPSAVMSFVNDSIGYIVSSRECDTGVYWTGYLARTRDGGETWTRENFYHNTSIPFGSLGFVDQISFAHEDLGWGIGGYYPSGMIYRRTCELNDMEIAASGPLLFDIGDSVLLSLPSSPIAQYEWSTGATTQSIVAKRSGHYIGTVTFADACIARDTVTVTVDTRILPLAETKVDCPDCDVLGIAEKDAFLFAGCGLDLSTYDMDLRPLRRFAHSNDSIRVGGIVGDASGSLYAAVSIAGDSSVLLRFDRDGTTRMVRGIPGGDANDPPRVLTTPDGNLVFAYVARTAGVDVDLYLEKLDREGRVLWTRTHTSGFLPPSRGPLLVVDAEGAIYFLAGTVDVEHDLLLQKIASDGERLWKKSIGFEPGSLDYPAGLLLGKDGAALVAGELRSPDGRSIGHFIVAVEREGKQAWDFPFFSPTDVTILGDEQGGAYLLMHLDWEQTSSTTSVLYHIDAEGEITWTKGYTTSPTSAGILHLRRISAAATDTRGSLYLAGTTTYGQRIERIDPDGVRRWEWFDTSSTGAPQPAALAVSKAGDIYLLHRDDTGASAGCVVKSFLQAEGLFPLSITMSDRSRDVATLSSVDPNPASNSVDVRLHLSTSTTFSLDLLDPMGRPERSLYQGRQPAGEHRMTLRLDHPRLSSGLYYLLLVTDTERSVTPLMIVR